MQYNTYIIIYIYIGLVYISVQLSQNSRENYRKGKLYRFVVKTS